MQLLIILLLVLMNGLLAMSEIAIVSARRPLLRDRAETGSNGAQVALELAEEPNRFLSTVQIGITLVGVVAGAFGGATVGRQFGDWLVQVIPIIAPYSELIGIGLVVLLTTYLSLVLGELFPKRLALQFPEMIASIVAPPMKQVSQVFAPVVWLLSHSTNLLLRLMGIDPNAETRITESEVIGMIEEGMDKGVFDQEEARMVQGVFELDDRTVASIMTPRPEIDSLNLEDSIVAIKEKIISTPHSFYPVFDAKFERVVGIIKAKDLLTPLVRGEEINLQDLMRPPLLIPGVAVVSRALETFKTSGAQIALVVGEHGGIEGLLTANDVIEMIVGDIDADDPVIVQREDGSWLLDGGIPLGRFAEFLPEKLMLPADEVGSYRTLAGFVMARLGRLPEIADVFNYGGLRFEVVDMDGARVDRVLVSRIDGQDTDETNKNSENEVEETA